MAQNNTAKYRSSVRYRTILEAAHAPPQTALPWLRAGTAGTDPTVRMVEVRYGPVDAIMTGQHKPVSGPLPVSQLFRPGPTGHDAHRVRCTGLPAKELLKLGKHLGRLFFRKQVSTSPLPFQSGRVRRARRRSHAPCWGFGLDGVGALALTYLRRPLASAMRM